eukprot:jgi/Tetstr1/456580/TSEL_043298.t1
MGRGKGSSRAARAKPVETAEQRNWEKFLSDTNRACGDKTLSATEALADTRSWQDILAATCDARINAADPYGDGDQSLLVGNMPGDPGQSLREVWCSGADFNPIHPSNSFSTFATACFVGDANVVRSEINAARELGPDALTRLLEKRESSLRVPPIIVVIAGARSLIEPAFAAAFRSWVKRGSVDHSACAEALLDAGCRIDAQDVAGYNPLHHCTSGASSKQSLDIALLIGQKRPFADVSRVASAPNRMSAVPLAEPTMKMLLPNVAVLLELGADPGVGQDVGGGRVITPRWLTQLWPSGGDAMSAAVTRRAAVGDTRLVGRMAVLNGVSSPELNGQTVLVKRLITESGRYEVLLDGGDGRSVAVEPRRLRLHGLEGKRVVLHSLSRAELNGREGTCGRFCVQRGRYEVTLDSSTAGSEPLGIKPANLKLVQRNKLAGEGCSHCGVLEGKLLRCTRCLRAQYCSKECQVAHYKGGHAAPCKATAQQHARIPLPKPAKASFTVVKVQVPMRKGTRNDLLLYNETRDVYVTVPSSNTRYAELMAAVEDHGVKGGMEASKGCKVYLPAVVLANGAELVVDWERIWPPQAW